jgi:hypothetical protein
MDGGSGKVLDPFDHRLEYRNLKENGIGDFLTIFGGQFDHSSILVDVYPITDIGFHAASFAEFS